jgi:hypothetical protein
MNCVYSVRNIKYILRWFPDLKYNPNRTKIIICMRCLVTNKINYMSVLDYSENILTYKLLVLLTWTELVI